MRTSLLPGIWKNILENSKHKDAFRLFEIGFEIHKRGSGLPEEIPHLVAALYDRQGDGSSGLFELKRAAECLMPGARACPAEPRPFEHPARSADIVWKGQTARPPLRAAPVAGRIGPRGGSRSGPAGGLAAERAAEIKYTPIRRYPSSAFDLSVVAGLREHAGDLEASVASFAGPLVNPFSSCASTPVRRSRKAGKSVSFRLTVGSPERTLSSEEVGEIRARIIEGCARWGTNFGCRVVGQDGILRRVGNPPVAPGNQPARSLPSCPTVPPARPDHRRYTIRYNRGCREGSAGRASGLAIAGHPGFPRFRDVPAIRASSRHRRLPGCSAWWPCVGARACWRAPAAAWDSSSPECSPLWSTLPALRRARCRRPRNRHPGWLRGGASRISGERERFLLELEPHARAQVTLYTKANERLPR